MTMHTPGSSPIQMEEVLELLKSRRTIILPADSEVKILQHQPVLGWRGDTLTPYYNMCVWHGSEAIFTTSIVCFECGHVYADDLELLVAQHEAVLRMKELDTVHFAHISLAVDPDEITFCQECLHDF